MTTRNQPDSIANPAWLLLREVWSRGDLALVDELVTADYVQYDPVFPEPIQGPEALEEAVATYRRGTPDLTKTVEGTFVDAPTVVVPYTATGTHDGEFLGVDPTGREIEVKGVFVSCVEGRKLAEGTDMWDAFGLFQQVGALPEPLAD